MYNYYGNRTKPLSGKPPSDQNPTPAKKKKNNPVRPPPPPAKIPLWPKPSSHQTKAPSGKTKNILLNPILSLINKYHPKLG